MATIKYLEQSETFNKIVNVPLVAGSVSFISRVISAHPLLERTYNLADAVAAKLFGIAEPVTNFFAPQFKYVDGVATYVFNFAEKKFPYPFTLKPEDISSFVKSKKEYGFNVIEGYKSSVEKTYDDRVVAPAKELFKQVGSKYDQVQSENVFLQNASASITSIYEQLANTLQSLSKKSQPEIAEGEKKVETIVGNLFAELDNLQRFAQSLPVESQKRFQPILSTFNDAYKELYKETLQSNAPLNVRVGNLIKFVREHTVPALKNALFAPLEETQQRAQDLAKPTVEQVHEVAHDAADKGKAMHQEVSAGANQATGHGK